MRIIINPNYDSDKDPNEPKCPLPCPCEEFLNSKKTGLCKHKLWNKTEV
jgi:hypothetical protein